MCARVCVLGGVWQLLEWEGCEVWGRTMTVSGGGKYCMWHD